VCVTVFVSVTIVALITPSPPDPSMFHQKRLKPLVREVLGRVADSSMVRGGVVLLCAWEISPQSCACAYDLPVEVHTVVL